MQQRQMETAPASRSPCGERGLKSLSARIPGVRGSRSPCGERGLKSRYDARGIPAHGSLPVRGAWIEMTRRDGDTADSQVAPRAGSVD